MSLTDLPNLLSTGEGSDCTIECWGTTFKVHKSVICPQSPVFKAAFEGNFSESKTCHFKIEDFSLGTVKRMLRFMYGAPNVWPEKPEPPNDTDADDGQPPKRRRRGRRTITPKKSVKTVKKATETANTNTSNGDIDRDQDGDGYTGDEQVRHSLEQFLDDKVFEIEGREEILRRVQILVELNSIGDFYSIENLCKESSEKIEWVLRRQRDHYVYCATARLLVQTTGDASVQKAMAQVAASYIQHFGDVDLGGLESTPVFAKEFLKSAAARVGVLNRSVAHYKIYGGSRSSC